MRVAVFGGTGKTGWMVVRYAVDRGYGCKVLTRQPERMPSVPGVEYVEGSAVNGGRVMLTLTGCDAVVVALRGDKKAPAGFLGTSMSHIVTGMRKLQIPRIVVLSAMGAGDSMSGVGPVRRLALSTLGKKELEDLSNMEKIIMNSDLQWTVMRPARLTDDEPGAEPRLGTSYGDGVKPVSREDAAISVVDEIEKGAYLRQCPYVSG